MYEENGPESWNVSGSLIRRHGSIKFQQRTVDVYMYNDASYSYIVWKF